MSVNLSRQLFSKRPETGETKPNPTRRQFETYEFSPLRKDIGGKFYGFKGEEIVGTRREVRRKRGEFSDFNEVGIRGDNKGKINRRIAPFRYGEREPQNFKETGIRYGAEKPYQSIYVGDSGARQENFSRTLEEIMKTPTYLEDQRFFRRPYPAIPIYVDMEGKYRKDGKIISEEQFKKIIKENTILTEDNKIRPLKTKPSLQLKEKDGEGLVISTLKERPPKPFKVGGEGPRILTKQGATGSNEAVYNYGSLNPKIYFGSRDVDLYGASVVGGKGVDFPLNVKGLEADLNLRGLNKGDTGLLSLDGERKFTELKKRYEEKNAKMTRAQQRKLGRIIKNRVDKPIRIGKSVSVEGQSSVVGIDFRELTAKEKKWKVNELWQAKKPVLDFSESFFINDAGAKIILKEAPKELLTQLEKNRVGIKRDIADKVYYTSDRLRESEGELRYNTLSKGDGRIGGGKFVISKEGKRMWVDGGSHKNIRYRELNEENSKILSEAEKKMKDWWKSDAYFAKKKRQEEKTRKAGFDLHERIINPYEFDYNKLSREFPDKFSTNPNPVLFPYGGKNYKFNFRGKETIKPLVVVKGTKVKKEENKYVRTGGGGNLYGDKDFSIRLTGRGGGRRFYTMNDKSRKLEWWQRGKNQQEVSKRMDAESVPPQQYQLRGIRDPRSSANRIIGPRSVRQVDHNKTYKSARDEALIQMRINESAGVRDAKKKVEEVRQSEAEKRKNLVLLRKTAEATAKALRDRNAGLTHSHNVNVRNNSNATLLGSDPDELNKIIKRGGGISLIKDMIRKGEISDLSTISQLDLSVKQITSLRKLLDEGGEYVEGNEYFYRFIDEFGQTKVARGYLNKGGNRGLNLDLMYLRTNDDGTQTKERKLVPKKNVISPDVSATTTSSGKAQQPRGDRRLFAAELDTFDLGASPSPLAEAPLRSRQTRGRSGEVDRDASEGLLGILRRDGAELIGSEIPRVRSPSLSPETFDFSLEPSRVGGGEALPSPLGSGARSDASVFDEEEGSKWEEELLKGIDDYEEDRQPQPQPEPEYVEEDEDIERTIREWSQDRDLEPEPSPDTPPPRPTTPPPKAVSFVGETLPTDEADEAVDTVSPYENYNFDEAQLPADRFVEVDFLSKGKKERLGELLSPNEILLWSTKYGGEKNSKKSLVVNKADMRAILKSAEGKSLVINGKRKVISKKKASDLYKKVEGQIDAGKQETAFNDETIVRLIGLDERLSDFD